MADRRQPGLFAEDLQIALHRRERQRRDRKSAQHRGELAEIVLARIGDAIGNSLAVERLRAPACRQQQPTCDSASGSGRALMRAAVPQPRPDERLAMHRPCRPCWPWPALTSAMSIRFASRCREARSLDWQNTSTSTFGWLAAKRARISRQVLAGVIVRRAEPDRPLDLRARENAASPRRRASGFAGRSRPAPRRPASG